MRASGLPDVDGAEEGEAPVARVCTAGSTCTAGPPDDPSPVPPPPPPPAPGTVVVAPEPGTVVDVAVDVVVVGVVVVVAGPPGNVVVAPTTGGSVVVVVVDSSQGKLPGCCSAVARSPGKSSGPWAGPIGRRSMGGGVEPVTTSKCAGRQSFAKVITVVDGAAMENGCVASSRWGQAEPVAGMP